MQRHQNTIVELVSIPKRYSDMLRKSAVVEDGVRTDT